MNWPLFILAAVAVLAADSLIVRNKIVYLNNKCKELIIKLNNSINTCYSQLEQIRYVLLVYEIDDLGLLEVIPLGITQNPNLEEIEVKISTFDSLTETIESFLARFEILKTSDLYLGSLHGIKRELTQINKDLQIYNKTARKINFYLKEFPSNLIARSLGIKTQKLLNQ